MIKLIALFALLLIISYIRNSLWEITPKYEKCYSDMEYEGYASMGCCGGITGGGTKATDYLSETCCGCPHLVLGCNPIRKEEE